MTDLPRATTDRPTCRFVTATTLDGYLADEQDRLDWLFVQDHDPAGAGGIDAFLADVGAVVMGATTYRWVVEHLAASGEAWPYAQPTFVFTHHPIEPAADTVRRVEGPVADAWPAVAEAAGDGHVWVVGGGGLAAEVAAAGLLDEVEVSIAPVTLGAGRPLFPRPFDLRLESVERNRAFVVARYAVVGAREG